MVKPIFWRTKGGISRAVLKCALSRVLEIRENQCDFWTWWGAWDSEWAWREEPRTRRAVRADAKCTKESWKLTLVCWQLCWWGGWPRLLWQWDTREDVSCDASTTGSKESSSMKQSKYILDKCPLDYLDKIHNQLRVKNDLIDYLSRVWKFEIIIKL